MNGNHGRAIIKGGHLLNMAPCWMFTWGMHIDFGIQV